MLNKVILIGNVGNDPDIKMLPSGGKVANISLATSENWRDKDGNKQTRTEWHRISVFNENLIRIVEQYITKGSQIYIEGSLKTRKYTDASGVEKYSTDVVIQGYSDTIKMLGSSKSGGYSGDQEGLPSSDSGSRSSGTIESSSGTGQSSGNIDDDIPF